MNLIRINILRKRAIPLIVQKSFSKIKIFTKGHI